MTKVNTIKVIMHIAIVHITVLLPKVFHIGLDVGPRLVIFD